MKAFIQNQLMRKMIEDASKHGTSPLFEACRNAGLLGPAEKLEIVFGWSSLLEYIGEKSLFKTFPLFSQHNELFAFLISTLALNTKKDLLARLYDQIFVECLTQVKALPQIDQNFLLHHIREKRKALSSQQLEELFSASLNQYEKVLTENPYHALHDLTLYLAWDRVCINLAIIFEHPFSNPAIGTVLDILKECLLESFQHITQEGRTSPSFFRLLEALYAYQMRDEYLQSYPEGEWLILCEGSKSLTPREEVADLFYIDEAIVNGESSNKEPLMVFTMKTGQTVKSTLALANYMLKKLRGEVPGWHYALSPAKVICVKEEDVSSDSKLEKLIVDKVV